jgi:signal transduction histidine kinase
MKLFTKYNRINLIATILVFLISSMSFYFLVRFILIDQVDEDLEIEQREIETFVSKFNRLPEYIPVKDQRITYAFTNHPLARSIFKTYTGYDSSEKKNSSFRKLDFGIKVKNRFTNVTVTKSLEGTADLLHTILLVTFSTILIMLVVSVMINRIILKRLWKPFYESLSTITNFKIDKSKPLNFSQTGVEEFDFMNKVLETTTRQARQDYFLLKEFTENASHEIQTPLAIIRSKIDLLIQSDLSKQQMNTVQSAYQSIEKLSRLNQSLLLLAKIENKQFADKGLVNLGEKINEKMNSFHELWQNQHITVSVQQNDTFVSMNKALADILLNNLFSNATRHNVQNGIIQIALTKNRLIFKNSSEHTGLDKSRLFTRFGNPVEHSLQNGLGLSIIKQICDASNFEVTYFFKDELHHFMISWNDVA